MEFVGLLVGKVADREGNGQNGHWRTATFLLKEVTMYPKQLVVDVKDDGYGKIEEFEALIGRNVKVQFEIKASEYQGRWYNNVKAYRIKDIAEENANTAAAPEAAQPEDDPFKQLAEQQDLP